MTNFELIDFAFTQKLLTEDKARELKSNEQLMGLSREEFVAAFANQLGIQAEHLQIPASPVEVINPENHQPVLEESTPSEPISEEHIVIPDDAIHTNRPSTFRSPKPEPWSRQKLYTWFGIGGVMWLLGILIIGLWIGGCFSNERENPPRNPPKAK